MPVWATVICVMFAALIVFCSTYVFLTDRYNTSLNELEARGIELSKDPIKFQSAVSPELANMYSLIDEISELYEKHYIREADYEKAAKNLVAEYANATGDRYAYYYTAEDWEKEQGDSNGNSVGIGVYVEPYETSATGKLLITHVMNDSPAKKAGLADGDVVVSIDGTDLSSVTYSEAVSICLGEVGTDVVLEIMRGENKLTVTVTRNTYEVETVIYEMIETDGRKIGYIRILQFYYITVEQFENAVDTLRSNGCDGIIFDVRSNPGGMLYSVCEMLDYLLPSGPIVKLTYKNGAENVYRSNSKCVAGVPMVVITNESTASAAELFTAALKDYDYATVVGTKTFGKGCGQTTFDLKNGGKISITSFLYSPPYSDNYDGVGIYPDIEAELDADAANKSIFTLEKNEDNQLKAAIDEMLKKIKDK